MGWRKPFHKGASVSKNVEKICLKHDNGEDLCFTGRLFSESSWFDEETGVLTRQQLFSSENGEQVYYIIRSRGRDERSRHAYRMAIEGEQCVINNGKCEITLNFDMLMLAVRGLCGLSEDAVPPLSIVEEMLRAANA